MRVIFIIFLISSAFNLFAQSNEIKREIKYTAEAGTILSSNGETPVWLRANQYGIVPLSSQIFTLRGSVSSDYKKGVTKEDQYKLSKFDWGYGLNIVGNIGKESRFLIPEAYVKAKFGIFEMYAGRRKEVVGLVDTTLSSGSYIWSGNALPMPKVQISTPNYVPIGFTDGFLSFKGTFAHGWFENTRSDVKNFYLHQKTLYLRFGKSDWKFHFYGGFNHQVQWGGELLYPDPDNKVSIKGIVGSTFTDYLNAVTGISLAGVGDTTKNGKNDATNRGGNHLGTIDFGFNISLRNANILLYRQNIYDDGSLAYLNNIPDGLNGLSIEFKENTDANFQVKKVVFEYLNTASQGGATGSNFTNARLRGQDDYFNNSVYLNGWTYSDMIIGHPLITYGQKVNNVYERNIYNNRVQMFFLATTLRINRMVSTIRLISSTNKGSYIYPLDINQFSFNWASSFPLREKLQLKTALSVESNNSNANVGGMVSVVKSW
jgi:hypothetical protein